MPEHESINYIEYPAVDLVATKRFFERVFDWQFVDYGADYSAFSESGLDGGFYRSVLASTTAKGSGLMVFYSANIKGTQTKIEQHGGKINKALFNFPGGRRFHFIEPSGNEFAVWSEQSQ
jgi:hypothetical protein